MEGRGRRSSASLSVVASNDFDPKPAPPADLTKEQAAEWVSIVDRLPAEWFARETWPLLAQYCRHVVSARRVAKLITRAESADELNVNDYDRLLKMQEREARMISTLATKMRISQQSTYDKSKRKPASINKPWDD